MANASAVRLLGQENYERLRSSRVLLVGAGGIGCELLKNLVLMGFGEIHIVDLDIIDLSNLNRQFLFRQRDIKQAKATTAARAIEHVSNSKLVAHQANIMDVNQFPLAWFSQFSIFFNALDNLEARRYVNQMAQYLRKPLLESGTAGFDGYIQPIIPGATECFDCTTKETPKTFPVCTIRSTPSQPIHCIVWAKNFLFSQLFASSGSMSADEDLGTDNVEEIERIRQETNELHELQELIRSGDKTRIRDVFEKVFVKDIEKLLAIEELWKAREKPTPLYNFKFDEKINKNLNTVWTIQEQVNAFVLATEKLMQRLSSEKQIEFDKDDPDTLLFVAAAANIRASVFKLPLKSVFDIKQIAGGIIPAIATTNAIIAGLSSLASLRVLNLLKNQPKANPTELNMAFTAKASNMSNNRYLSNPQLGPPNPRCPVCSIARGVLTLSQNDLDTMRLSELVGAVQEKYSYSGEVSVLDKSTQRLLADFDFEDLLNKTLAEVKVARGTILLISDEQDSEESIRAPVELYIEQGEPEGINLPDIEVPLIKPAVVEPDETNSEEGVSMPGEIILDEDDKNPKKRHLDDASETPAKKALKTEEEHVVILD
ncbi:E1 ubiquitin-activating protein UBA2 [Lachancea thermotolerans CBS 6340]|uniref:Ubiquitin-activating enzyme E1-like n=1 Tax=Lachancea thermotolerans (strain ATCC 56472 / CBS 6340 / NRRL Y-8284) TaxID=559295 RepID=C5DJB5_LACTC|nr:KLTH0F15070p [Lachancea thermotolerans CBS 6340]CAR24404.1 KLTH0F15070p [Lachancea thermotolerans CBS 6340]